MRRTTVRRSQLVGACAASLVTLALTVTTGCSARPDRTAGVAPTFSTVSGPASSAASPTPSPSAELCPLPSPQLFVEGKRASAQGAQVSFSYLDAQRICSADENARYVTTGTTLTTKPVSPSAVVLLLAPGGGADELQVPPPALPAAMASAKDGPPYYAITLDGSGTITRIEQAYLP
jgi:hypothetical protein